MSRAGMINVHHDESINRTTMLLASAAYSTSFVLKNSKSKREKERALVISDGRYYVQELQV
jgi:hypothetical protein